MILSLQGDGLPTLVLDRPHGYRVATLTLPTAATRSVAEDRVNASGTVNSTRLAGASTASMTIAIVEDAARTMLLQDLIDALRLYCDPAYRPYLVLDFEGERASRRVPLVADSASTPFEVPGYSAASVAWIVPDGVAEALDLTTATVSAQAAPEPGITVPLTVPIRVPGSTLLNTTLVTNPGTAPSAPVLQLWGPCTGPKLTNATTGLSLSLPGLTLGADQYVEVTVKDVSVLLNGRPSESVYGSVDLATSSFWWLARGANYLRYAPASWSGNARAVVSYRPTWK